MEKCVLVPEAQAALDDLNGMLTKLFDLEHEFEYFPRRHPEIFAVSLVVERDEFEHYIQECQLICNQVYNEIIFEHAEIARQRAKK